MALFDAYIMVDWSARNSRARGKDSIWIAVRRGRLVTTFNPPTRAVATSFLRQTIRKLRNARKRVLVGFDFPFGYPRGVMASLRLTGSSWKALWRFLRDHVEDDDRNASNRFELAADLNRRLCSPTPDALLEKMASYPFWGCPVSQRRHGLASKKGWGKGRLPVLNERRLCEGRREANGAFTVWQLFGAGSVGGQVLLGLPRLESLRRDPSLRRAVAVWPFETSGLSKRTLPPVVIAEIWPSLWPNAWLDLLGRSRCKDEAQTAGVARHLARLDGKRRLGSLVWPRLPWNERLPVLREEGWILGLT